MADVSDVAVDVLVVGAGPAGSAAALHAARAGHEVLVVEAGPLGRDKTCGDGLTPRAIHQLERLGLADAITSHYVNHGLKLHGYGGDVTAPWPSSAYGTLGSAMPRTAFDEYLARAAIAGGATVWDNATATAPDVIDGTLTRVTVTRSSVESTVRARWVIVADGVRSTFGRQLGREWHRGEVYGIAARSYVSSSRSDDPWMHSHVELRDEDDTILPGYGWIFPLADGTVNLGCGALSTDARPARLNTKKLLAHYARQQRTDWGLGEPERVTSAMLPMGGAVSGVAGRNWMIIGDAAAGVNPLNGEGIDYGLEMAEHAVTLLDAGYADLTDVWPQLLRDRYGEAFLLARTAARLLTYPKFLPAVGPLALRGPVGARLMPTAARLMANLITDEDRDLMARLWRAAGGTVSAVRRGTPLWS
ncbi:geranylgeranyl reductase family protein [Corynebacterium guangdongense]|uniref:geranylgeranyl reductase family protein n=1 Tax=Corynebacterium guangdongense TaxID=1783348 RepID=UPI0025B3D45F|nr:geranylgeranyl reductase family protein [Corynebacterium guangdongense]WJZ17048.1 Putative oxidoreductase [Corynebacterium guangdongense]